MFIDNLDPRDLVAQFHWQIEARLHIPRRAQIKARIADGDALHVERPQQALRGAFRLGADHPHVQRARAILGACDGQRRLVLHQSMDGVFACGGAQTLREGAGGAVFEAVRKPDDLRLLVGGEELLQGWQSDHAIRNERRGLEGAQALQGLARIGQQHIAPALGHDEQAGGAAIATRRLRPLAGGLNALRPGGRRWPAIIDDEQQRPARPLAGRQGIPDGASHGQNDEGGDGEAQQQQPPGGARRGLLAGRQIEDQPQGRKGDLARARRGDAQQQIERGQKRQRGEHHGRGEGERETKHQAAPCPASMRIRRASSACAAGRSVRCTVKLQPRDRQASRTASRWAARRAI